MAAKKKGAGTTYDPALRARVVGYVKELIAKGEAQGAQARAVKRFNVPQSAVTYWMSAERAQRSRAVAVAPPPLPPTNGNGHTNGHSPAKSLSDALAAYLDPLIEARIDQALSRRMQRMMEK